MKQQQLDELITLFSQETILNKKTKRKRQVFLLKLPLFILIYQKKGQENFNLIIEKITINRYQFGYTIFDSKIPRFFCYIIKGSVMVFISKNNQLQQDNAIFHSRLEINGYFGQKKSYREQEIHSVKSVSNTYLLRLDLQTFYKTFSGHFLHAELQQDLIFLKQLWAFNKIKPTDIERILLLSKTKKYHKDKILFRQNDLPLEILLVYDGQITLFKNKPNGLRKYQPFCILVRGEICGIQEVIHQSRYNYDAICTTQWVKIMHIPKNLFHQIVAQHISEEMYIKYQKSKQQLINNLALYEKTNINRRKSEQSPQKAIIKKRVKTFSNEFKVTKEMELKTKDIRDYRLNCIRNDQKKKFRESRLSDYTNYSYSNDKQLLIQYLYRKTRQTDLQFMKQEVYQHNSIYTLKQIAGKKSAAVKNQKRKQNKSRRLMSVSSMKW